MDKSNLRFEIVNLNGDFVLEDVITDLTGDPDIKHPLILRNNTVLFFNKETGDTFIPKTDGGVKLNDENSFNWYSKLGVKFYTGEQSYVNLKLNNGMNCAEFVQHTEVNNLSYYLNSFFMVWNLRNGIQYGDTFYSINDIGRVWDLGIDSEFNLMIFDLENLNVIGKVSLEENGFDYLSIIVRLPDIVVEKIYC